MTAVIAQTRWCQTVGRSQSYDMKRMRRNVVVRQIMWLCSSEHSFILKCPEQLRVSASCNNHHAAEHGNKKEYLQLQFVYVQPDEGYV